MPRAQGRARLSRCAALIGLGVLALAISTLVANYAALDQSNNYQARDDAQPS